ncbi:MAG: hypothetical protein MJ151_03600, partial [Lachnospiraceae bacterium]|nr:hypothetical protein [Lachnospiraceae bacterium]
MKKDVKKIKSKIKNKIKKSLKKGNAIIKEKKAELMNKKECRQIQDEARKNQKALKKANEKKEKDDLIMSARVIKGKNEKATYEFNNNIDIVYKNIIERDIEDENIRNAVAEVISSAQKKQNGFEKLMSFYQCALMEIETKFKVLNQEFSMKHDRNPICSIQTRLKSYDSIMEKLGRKGWDISLATIEKNMMDIAGIRVVCTFKNDVYMLAQRLLAQDDVTLIQKKDYIAKPKENGYRSLHLILSIPIFLETEKKILRKLFNLRLQYYYSELV